MQVCQLSVIQYNEETQISCVLLQGVSFSISEQKSGFAQMFAVLGTYFKSPVKNEKVYLKINGEFHQVNTDSKGVIKYFHRKKVNELEFYRATTEQPFQIVQKYPFYYGFANSSFDIISDIDDTIIKSNTADFFKRVGKILFKVAKKRRTIETTEKVFQELQHYKPRIFYVSKSESNLFGLLSNIILQHGLPMGPLFLTPWLRWYQLFSPKKAPNYKFNTIASILTKSANKKFILFGDDSQHDMDAYKLIINKFPNRIVWVFIRQTKVFRTPRQQQKWEALQLSGVHCTSYKEFEELNIIEILHKHLSI